MNPNFEKDKQTYNVYTIESEKEKEFYLEYTYKEESSEKEKWSLGTTHKTLEEVAAEIKYFNFEKNFNVFSQVGMSNKPHGPILEKLGGHPIRYRGPLNKKELLILRKELSKIIE